MVDELKTKNRVAPKAKVNYDHAIDEEDSKVETNKTADEEVYI